MEAIGCSAPPPPRREGDSLPGTRPLFSRFIGAEGVLIGATLFLTAPLEGLRCCSFGGRTNEQPVGAFWPILHAERHGRYNLASVVVPRFSPGDKPFVLEFSHSVSSSPSGIRRSFCLLPSARLSPVPAGVVGLLVKHLLCSHMHADRLVSLAAWVRAFRFIRCKEEGGQAQRSLLIT